MIKYVPIRFSISASVKDEQTFDTLDQMKLFLLNTAGRIALYIGKNAYIPSDIVICDSFGDDPYTGLKNVRPVLLKSRCIGYCGE